MLRKGRPEAAVSAYSSVRGPCGPGISSPCVRLVRRDALIVIASLISISFQ